MPILTWQPKSFWSTAVLLVAIAIVTAVVDYGVTFVAGDLVQGTNLANGLTGTQQAEVLVAVIVAFILDVLIIGALYS
jgi:phage-related holin